MFCEKTPIILLNKRKCSFLLQDELLGKRSPYVPHQEEILPKQQIQLAVLKEGIDSHGTIEACVYSNGEESNHVSFERNLIIQQILNLIEKGEANLPLAQSNPITLEIPSKYTRHVPDTFPGDNEGDGYAMPDYNKTETKGTIRLQVWFDEKENLVTTI